MINKWNFQTPSEEELHKRDQLVAELGFSPVTVSYTHLTLPTKA